MQERQDEQKVVAAEVKYVKRLVSPRLARVVAWLEDLSSERLDQDEAALQRAGGARIQFSEREGLPLNTLDSLSQRSLKAPQKLVTALDPDAATRCLSFDR